MVHGWSTVQSVRALWWFGFLVLVDESGRTLKVCLLLLRELIMVTLLNSSPDGRWSFPAERSSWTTCLKYEQLRTRGSKEVACQRVDRIDDRI